MSRRGVLTLYLTVTVVALFLIGLVAWNSSRLTDRITAKDNATRCQVVALVKTFTENSARSAQATLASKLATAEQKAVAKKNLDSVTAALAKTSEVLGHPVGTNCQTFNP